MRIEKSVKTGMDCHKLKTSHAYRVRPCLKTDKTKKVTVAGSRRAVTPLTFSAFRKTLKFSDTKCKNHFNQIFRKSCLSETKPVVLRKQKQVFL